MKSENMNVNPRPEQKVEEVPEWKLEAERIKNRMRMESEKERAEIIRRREEKALLEQQRIAREQEVAEKQQKNMR